MKKAIYLVLAGVAFGLLVAPRSGSETLEKLKKGFKDWKDDAKDQLNDVISKGKAMANTLND
jgi:gas vesicle protein